MFHLSYTTPHEGPIETLRFHEDPRRLGLGTHTDVDGPRWDVPAIRGEHINARKVGHHPEYYSTASFGQSLGGTGNIPDPLNTWPPYAVEIVPKPS